MDYTEEQFWPQLMQLSQTIDGLDYYQILNLTQQADERQIRTAYYQMSRALHPDKFYNINNPPLRAAVNKIFKRVTEAYTILRDAKKRALYTERINGPERATRLRFDETLEQEEKNRAREEREVAKTAQGKKMYLAAVADMQAGRWDKAVKNLQSALLFEPGNETLKQLKEECAAKAAG